MMAAQIESRLNDLKREYQLGESRLRELSQQEVILRETLLRISGAIQVLQELMGADGDAAASSVDAESPDRHVPETLTVP